ncbi:hypothetical protein V1520DRAFT_350410 [Lipomyces starkeyi]
MSRASDYFVSLAMSQFLYYWARIFFRDIQILFTIHQTICGMLTATPAVLSCALQVFQNIFQAMV